jgi:predicted permease
MFESIRTDVTYALRWLARSPGFTLVAVASLAIGIGFNTAIFSVVDALLLRPLPVERPDRLVDVYTRGGDGDTYATSSYPDYLDFRDRNGVFSAVMAFSPAIAAVKAGEQSRTALGEVVSGNYFHVLGVGAALGRPLVPTDDVAGAARVVVISDAAWTRDYARDPQALGRVLRIHGQPYTIVGVAAPAFTGMVPMLQPEFWLPAAWVEEVEPAGIQDVVPSPGNTRLERRGQRWLFMKGRLKEGETAQRAEANLQLIMGQLAQAYPKSNEKRPISVASNVRVHPMADRMLRPVAIALMGGIGLVLLVACANVANMLLARAAGRQKEIGIRLAIGAGRRRIVRQMLTESVVLALAGAVGGIAVGYLILWIVRTMPMPLPLPMALSLHIDGRVLAFTIAIGTLAGVIAGLAPALQATRPDVVGELKGDTTGARVGRRRWTLGDGLVAAQTAVTLVLLVGAGLLTRSVMQAQQVSLGFNQDGLVAVAAEYSLLGYPDQRANQIFEQVRDRTRALPGVQSVSLSLRQPLALNYTTNTVFFPDRQQPGDPGLPVSATSVDGEYFSTLGVPLLQGRIFTAADTPASPRVAIVNDAFARTYWPGATAVGKRFRLRGIDGPEYEIVGVVGNYKVRTVGEPPTPYIHYPLSRRAFTGQVVMARTSGDANALVAAIRRAFLELEPNTVFFDAQPMARQVDTTLLPARLAAQTIGVVGLVATLLAAIGLYGVIAYAVSRRTREIGIRMALGAQPAGVLGMVMRQGLAVSVAGLAVGSVFAVVAARALSAALYGIGAADPVAWLGALTVLLGAAALANYIPARRAARVDPSEALRLQ